MKPEISVIVPVYNDAAGLETTLGSLVDQDVPEGSYEIIVADNGSGDGSLAVAEGFVAANSGLIKAVVEDQIQSSYAARNKGVLEARGDILCFIDADMWVEKDYLERIRNALSKTDIFYLGCNVRIVTSANNVIQRYHQFSGFPVERYIQQYQFAPTCGVVVRRSVFDKVGHFDPRLISSGDREFGNRVAEAGYTLSYDEHIIMYHPAYKTFRKFPSKCFRLGRGMFQLTEFYPSRYDFKYGHRPDLFNKREVSCETKRPPCLNIQDRVFFCLLTLMCKIIKDAGFLYERFRSCRSKKS